MEDATTTKQLGEEDDLAEAEGAMAEEGGEEEEKVVSEAEDGFEMS